MGDDAERSVHNPLADGARYTYDISVLPSDQAARDEEFASVSSGGAGTRWMIADSLREAAALLDIGRPAAPAGIGVQGSSPIPESEGSTFRDTGVAAAADTEAGDEEQLRREWRQGWDAGALYTLAILAMRVVEERSQAGTPEQRAAWDRVGELVAMWQADAPATPSAPGEAEAFAFLDGMYAIREDDVDPDYAARKWSQRGHSAPDEEDRAIVARMLARSAPTPTRSQPEEDSAEAVRADFAAVGDVLRTRREGGGPVALTPCRRCSHVFPEHLPHAAGCIAKGCTCPDYVATSRTEDEAAAGSPS